MTSIPTKLSPPPPPSAAAPSPEHHHNTTAWLLDFVLRQPISDWLAHSIFHALPLPSSSPLPRVLSKTILLRRLASDLSRRSISDRTLHTLELIDDLDRRAAAVAPSGPMRGAYCAVAVESSAACLRDPGGDFRDAVERIWRQRMGDLERSEAARLVSVKMKRWKKVMEDAVVKADVRRALREMDTENVALDAVGKYLEHAREAMGPPILDLLAEALPQTTAVRSKGPGSDVDNHKKRPRDATTPPITELVADPIPQTEVMCSEELRAAPSDDNHEKRTMDEMGPPVPELVVETIPRTDVMHSQKPHAALANEVPIDNHKKLRIDTMDHPLLEIETEAITWMASVPSKDLQIGPADDNHKKHETELPPSELAAEAIPRTAVLPKEPRADLPGDNHTKHSKDVMDPPLLELMAEAIPHTAAIHSEEQAAPAIGNHKDPMDVMESPLLEFSAEASPTAASLKEPWPSPADDTDNHEGCAAANGQETSNQDGCALTKFDRLPMSEVSKVTEALRTSCADLLKAVEDPLPHAVTAASMVLATRFGEARNTDEPQESRSQVVWNGPVDEANLFEKPRENHNEVAGNELDPGAAMEVNTAAEVMCPEGTSRGAVNNTNSVAVRLACYLDPNRLDPKESEGKQDRMAVNAQEQFVGEGANATHNEGTHTGIQGNKYRLVPRSLMERNPTAHTYEWDDSLSEGSPIPSKKCRLPSPRRRDVSPLKLQENKLPYKQRQRQRKKWSLQEEDTLRQAVAKYGVGNWKLILSSYTEIFEGRTQVDLKDKWRNMMRH